MPRNSITTMTALRTCPKRERVIRDLRRYLDGPECPANGRLPRETELASRFEVTRRTLRFALDVLAEEQLIERIHGKGTFRAGQHAGIRCIYFLVPCCDYALRVGLSNIVFLTRLHSILLAEGIQHNYQIITIPFSKTNAAADIDWDALRMIKANSLVFCPSLWFEGGFDFLLERNCRIALLSPSRRLAETPLPDTHCLKLYLGGDETGLMLRELVKHGARRPAIAGKFLHREPSFSAPRYEEELKILLPETAEPLILDGPFVDGDRDWANFTRQLGEFQRQTGFDALMIDIWVTATPDLRFPLAANLRLTPSTRIITRWEYDWSHLLQPAVPYVTYDFRQVVRDALRLLPEPPEHFTTQCYEPIIME